MHRDYYQTLCQFENSKGIHSKYQDDVVYLKKQITKHADACRHELIRRGDLNAESDDELATVRRDTLGLKQIGAKRLKFERALANQVSL